MYGSNLGVLQSRNVVKLDPCLGGVGIVSQGERRTNEMIWTVVALVQLRGKNRQEEGKKKKEGHVQKPSRSSTMVMSTGTLPSWPGNTPLPCRAARPSARSIKLRAAESPPYEPPRMSTLKGARSADESNREPMIADGCTRAVRDEEAVRGLAKKGGKETRVRRRASSAGFRRGQCGWVASFYAYSACCGHRAGGDVEQQTSS